MQKLDINKYQVPSTTTTSHGSPEDDQVAQTAKIVNAVFNRLTKICTAWKQALDCTADKYSGEYKKALLDALVANGITDMESIELGLSKVTSDFLPNPNRFAQWCKEDQEHWQHKRLQAADDKRKQLLLEKTQPTEEDIERNKQLGKSAFSKMMEGL